ncbi:hypothetical protein WICMUC_001436 [Wickerhamomyces mucosus]|uniref:Glutathione synthetase n=1 Tax=Wickerhamomyces mucosus TaxID=1378264 RepID=A0A9P8PW95_9ASCO|nr:hypothetical protein WICMUC_001436 [Wickerhamomyces mucosus]
MTSIPSLTSNQEKNLVTDLQQWALANSLIIYPPDFKSYQPVVAPVTLYPTPFSRIAFEQANEVQLAYNELYIKVTNDQDFLLGIIDELSHFDQEFTGKLYQTYLKAKEIGIKQNLKLGIFRSDYLVEGSEIKQVEFNTVSVSFGGLSTKVGQVHKFLNNIGNYDPESKGQLYYKEEDLPVSNSIEALAKGLADANYYYNGEIYKTDTIVLTIVQEGERNVFDQRLLEFELLSKHGIKSKRLSLSQIELETFVDSNTSKIFLKSTGEEISVVYFRAGYAPSDFQNEADWNARLILETSLAIKGPDLVTQLAGAKKIQQILTDEEILSKFIPNNSEHYQKLLKSFVKIYPLDDSELGKKGKSLAFETPEKFVLKPQREGGGNNVYKSDIPGFLKSLSEKEWSAYILMELINPSTFVNKIIRNDQVLKNEIISELGIFGVVLFDDKEVKVNENAGWLLRSKFSSSNEGGVAAGFGAVDSIQLV